MAQDRLKTALHALQGVGGDDLWKNFLLYNSITLVIQGHQPHNRQGEDPKPTLREGQSELVDTYRNKMS